MNMTKLNFATFGLPYSDESWRATFVKLTHKFSPNALGHKTEEPSLPLWCFLGDQERKIFILIG